MRDNCKNHVFVALDLEVEPPASCDSSLPNIKTLTIFLSMQGRMLQIGKQEPKLFCKGFADCDGQIGVISIRSVRESQFHDLRFLD